MYVILAYDIKQTGEFSKVQRRIFKVCKRYLFHIQNSIFEGELSKHQIFKLEVELKGIVRRNCDSVIIFKVRNKKWIEKTILTNQEEMNRQFI